MDCQQCEAAAKAEWHGFRSGCLGCAARAVARGPNYRESLAAGTQTRKYRSELDLLKVTHDQVRAAHAADALTKVTA